MAIATRQTFLAQLQAFNRLPNGQKLGLMLGLAFVVALLVGAWLWSRTPDYKVLYSNLADRDGGAILAALQQMNVPYKTAEGGGAILVPSEQVYDVRLRLASQGLPRGGNVGFELMDNLKFGASQFQEQVNYQRALEGELARSIQSLSAVQGARVHLAIPRPSVFVRDQQKPTASVLVSLFPGKALDPSQVAGIVHMVASSVPELSPKNVTVVDQSGNLLGAAGARMAQAGLEPGQLEYLQQVEQSFAQRIETILTPILGPGNVRAQVAADMDFSQVEQTAETFKPNATPGDATIRSQQSSESAGGSPTPSGVPGALSNQPPGSASAPVNGEKPPAQAVTQVAGNAHKESTVNYEVDKTIKHVRQQVGMVKRVSVAVVVNNRKVTGKDGKTALKPLNADEMVQVSNLVKEAVGFSQARGDTVNVVNAAFTGQDAEVPATPMWKDPGTLSVAKDMVKNLLMAGLVFFVVFGVLRPILRELAKSAPPPVEALPVAGGEGLPAPGAPPAKSVTSYEENLQAVKEFARQEPRVVANVVKEWVDNSE